jgi:nucleoside-diphosphate-sugar epimerase
MRALVTGAGGAIVGQLLDGGWNVVAHDPDRTRLSTLECGMGVPPSA